MGTNHHLPRQHRGKILMMNELRATFALGILGIEGLDYFHKLRQHATIIRQQGNERDYPKGVWVHNHVINFNDIYLVISDLSYLAGLHSLGLLTTSINITE